MDESLKRMIEKVGQKAAIDLQMAMENINERMDEEARKISEELKEIEKMLKNMTKCMGLPEIEETYESEEAQYRNSKGKGVCINAKEKTPQMPGQMSGTMPKTKVQGTGQTQGGPFILRPVHFSTIPQAHSFPQQQHQQPPYPKQQCPRNPTLLNTAKIGSRPQDSRPLQDPRLKEKFTPIPTSYARVYAQLKEQGILAPSFTEPINGPPFPKWYNPEESCAYHNGIRGHSIENCISLKHKVENLLKKGFITFDEPNVRQNLIPQHGNKQINMDEEAPWFQGIQGHAANQKRGNF